jgi:histone acetyltransferase HTATIP
MLLSLIFHLATHTRQFNHHQLTTTTALFIMAGGTPAGEPTVGSGEPRLKSLATPETIKTGCIAWVEKEGQPRRAEILSIKTTKSGKQFYCNFDNFNKRLDEWVPVIRLDFTREVEWPNPEKDKPKDPKTKKATTAKSKKTQPSKKSQKRPSKREQSVASEANTPHPWTGTELGSSYR